ncbi:recombinase family protein [Henriciella aquimarina]|uniref:hypothetical protein n=1 Tax=Henriciella aquimarina TaxID=545261 RepID=UPI0009FC2B79|nr:hypothetical protein [Henriciella aquimarina]
MTLFAIGAKRLNARGIQFEAMSGEYDLSTPDGGFTFTLRAALSEWEREKLPAAKLEAAVSKAIGNWLETTAERLLADPGAESFTNVQTAFARITEQLASRQSLVHIKSFTERKRGVETVLILGAETPNRDEALIKAVARAHAWMAEWRAGVSLPTLAKKLGWTTSPLR